VVHGRVADDVDALDPASGRAGKVEGLNGLIDGGNCQPVQTFGVIRRILGGRQA
jgi:hypothetical protein